MLYTFAEYSADVSRFAQYPEKGNNLIYPVMGLCGEAGELLDKIKKHYRNNYNGTLASMSAASLTTESKLAIMHEMGDVLWYLDALACELGVTLSLVAQLNHNKLADRNNRNVIKSEGDSR